MSKARPLSPKAPPAAHPVEAALAQAARLIETQPEAALAQVEAVLQQMPGLPPAELLACQALRQMGQGPRALPRLAKLAHSQPRALPVLWELAQLASETDHPRQAIAALESLTSQQPAIAPGWFLLAQQLRKLGHTAEAWRADLSGIHASSRDPELIKAAIAMNAGELDTAAAAIKARLERQSQDPAAIRLLGEILWRMGDMTQAIALVEQALTLAPGFDLAREFLIRLLQQANRLPDALAHAQTLTQSPIAHDGYRLLLASVLVKLGEQHTAGGIYEDLLAQDPAQPQVWQNLGHVYKTLGQQADAVRAYRQAVTHQPSMGEAWWSLANLKTVKLTPDDIAAMTAALPSLDPETQAEDIFHLHFSLGKAHEDAKAHAAAFAHYDQANRLRRQLILHDADDFSREVAATARTFSAPFIAQMGAGGCPAPDPIFVVGLPRSGSTLIEQILASHSQIEGTMELPEMMIIAGRLQARVDDGEFPDFAAMIASLTPADRLRLGEEYLDRTRVHRHTTRPLFIDKMPNNWQHVGLIKLILPHAKIIDARRHPLSCCYSGWKQHFARGQTFTYDLGEIGRYYRDYVALMAAYDTAAPGAVHRVIYESVVEDTEAQVRAVLDHISLPFEPACLEFYKNDRAVRTASSEQVRRPINRDGMEAWRPYAAYLGPLTEALGPVTAAYPAPPADWPAYLGL